MAKQISIKPTSGLVSFTGATSHSMNLNVNVPSSEMSFSGTGGSDLFSFNDSGELSVGKTLNVFGDVRASDDSILISSDGTWKGQRYDAVGPQGTKGSLGT